MKKIFCLVLALCMIGAAALAEFDTSSTITVYSREDGSGTRSAFVELFGVEEEDENGETVDMTTTEAVITNSTSVMLTGVAGDPSAIGYVSLGSLNDTVKALSVNGVEATVENIASGDYAISRPFNIATAAEVSEVAQDFINFIMSADGQAVITEEGYISVAEGEAYTASNLEGTVVVGGSSSVTPVMEKLAEAYAKVQPDVKIEVQQSDSSTGVSMAIEGTCDLGMASRDLKESEEKDGAAAVAIARDGIAVIVAPGSEVTELTSEQVRAIYAGDVTSWDDLEA